MARWNFIRLLSKYLITISLETNIYDTHKIHRTRRSKNTTITSTTLLSCNALRSKRVLLSWKSLFSSLISKSSINEILFHAKSNISETKESYNSNKKQQRAKLLNHVIELLISEVTDCENCQRSILNSLNLFKPASVWRRQKGMLNRCIMHFEQQSS